MDFYNDLITEKSWLVLQSLKNKLDFVTIGGWAVYLYTKSLKSKDIDIIVDYDGLGKLRTDFNVTKNERLKKYEGRREEIQIDIYLPFYSNLGIPAEEIVKNTKTVETFSLPIPELLLLLKQYAYSKRSLSAKGQKDKLDIFSLIYKVPIDWERYKKLKHQYGKKDYGKKLIQLVNSQVKVPELDLNNHQWSKVKKTICNNL